METPPATDPNRTGSSLRNLVDVILPCLEVVGARSVVEIGASHGDFTSELLVWAARGGAKVIAVEPAPEAELLALAEQQPELELVRETSHDALRALAPADAVIIDGDHNYRTVSADLRLIAASTAEAAFPLVLIHDVGWPHGRRDSYYAPERIPEEERQPLARYAYLDPENPGIADGGFLIEWSAEREGGTCNGVLTAVEDFMETDDSLQLAIVPAFFGLGLLWDRRAAWAGAVAEIVEPWDRDPLLGRLEANRCLRLARWARCLQRLDTAEQRVASRDRLLSSLLGSRAFAWGERLSRLHKRGRPAFSRQEVRRVLDKQGGRG
jgi:hypothetical protein